MARKFLTPIDLNKLELQNARIQNLATAPGSPTVGQVYFDTNDSKIKVWTGSAWDNVGSSQEEIEDYVNGLLAAGNGVELTYDDAGNTLTITNTGVLSLTGTADEVVVSASAGNVTLSLPSTINADTTGNAATATALETARTISLSGDVSGSASFDGTGNIDISATVQADSIALGTDTTGDYVSDVTAGTGISVTGTGEGASVVVTNEGVVSLAGTTNEIVVSGSVGDVTLSLPSTVYADLVGDVTGNADTATALQTARTIAFGGDLSGSASFDGTQDITILGYVDTNAAVNSVVNTDGNLSLSASVGNITANLASSITADVTGDLTGNADTATALETARTVSIAGPVSGSASFDGTSDITIATTQGADSVTLGTHTTGDYVATVSGTANEIEVTGTGEGAAVTIGLPDDVILTGDLTVGGDLTVSGSVTYVNTETIELADNIILFNSNATGSATEDAGIEVNRGSDTNVTLLWNETSNVWELNDGTSSAAIARRKAENVGNGASTSFDVYHYYNTKDVTVQVYDNSTFDTVEVDVVRTDVNYVTVSFATAPSANAYRVVVVG